MAPDSGSSRQLIKVARAGKRWAQRRIKRAGAHLAMADLRRRNRRSRESVTGDTEVIVSLTTYGQRLQTVAYTIESIAAGELRPRRCMLWLDDEKAFANRPESLRRLEARGLEVQLTENLGPHTKYYPALPTAAETGWPLVTADDDIIYPRSWLAALYRAHLAHPEEVHCHWASLVPVTGDTIGSYATWPRCRDTTASIDHFALGVSGVLYPPRMVEELMRRGKDFLNSSPKADDIWLHWVALQIGVPVRQVTDTPRHFPLVPGSQEVSLLAGNVAGGGNDRWIANLYGPEDIRRLREAAEQGGGSPN
jgi:hypothetical protein